jgi:hypothetical protein
MVTSDSVQFPAAAAVVVAFAVSGCGDHAGAPCAKGGESLRPITAGGPAATRYLPLAVGATWTYQVSGGLETTAETVTVEALDTFTGAEPGAAGYRVVTQKAYGARLVAWWEDRGDQIVRHRELAIDGAGAEYGDETFLPARPVVDESSKHTTVAASWKQQFSDIIEDSGGTYSDCKSDRFEVEAVEERVSVPAGTFMCLRVKRTDSGSTRWFARGVGEVKRVSGTTSELVSYDLAQH